MCETVLVKGSRIVGDRATIMSPPRELDSAQAHEVEEQLFTTNRQQSGRNVPISLPRTDFWENVKKLLSDIDLDIQDMLRVGATGIRLQNLQKRQANIRRIASDLARKRMVAMMQHAASQSMRATANTAKNQELPSLDWHRHDPEEKAFYHSLQIQIDRFKMGVDWNGMQNGIAGEGGMSQVRHAPGTMQLDSFSNKSLTGNPPPALAFEDDKPEKIEFTEIDEEDRFIDTEWPDLDEHIHADLDSNERIQETITSTPDEDEDMSDFMEKMVSQVRHAAAMELAPNSKASEIILEDTIVTQEVETEELIRVRIVESLPEAIINATGEEVTLEVGDVHFLDSLTAEMLVDGGFAKIAAL